MKVACEGRSELEDTLPLCFSVSGQAFAPLSYLFEDLANVEVAAERGAVGVQFLQYNHGILHHFLCQELVETLIPGSGVGETTF